MSSINYAPTPALFVFYRHKSQFIRVLNARIKLSTAEHSCLLEAYGYRVLVISRGILLKYGRPKVCIDRASHLLVAYGSSTYINVAYGYRVRVFSTGAKLFSALSVIKHTVGEEVKSF